MSHLDDLRAQRDSIKAERSQLVASIKAVHERAGTSPLTAGQQDRFDRDTARAAQLGDDLARLDERIDAEVEQIEARRAEITARAAANPHHVVPGSPGRDEPYGAPQVMRRTASPFAPENRDPIEARAAQAIETLPYGTDAQRQTAIELLERAPGDDALVGVAEHLYRASDPAYARAFAKVWRRPVDGHHTLTADEARAWSDVNAWHARAAMSLTGANGGYLVPQFLDPTIHLTNSSTANDVRRIAHVSQTTVDSKDFVSSDGVTAGWLAEGIEASDNSPTFAQPSVTVHKAAAYIEGSYEVIMDSGFDEVGRLLADAKDRLEGEAFINGTGSGQPYGLITRLSGTGPVVVGTSGAAGAADFVAADIYAMDDALGARWRNNAAWLAAKPTYNDVRQMGTNDTAHAFWCDFGGGIPSQLIGYPVYTANEMDTTVVSGSNDYILLLGDFEQYKVVDRIGLTVAFNPMVVGANQMPTGQAGWFGYWRVGADIISSNAFRLLKV